MSEPEITLRVDGEAAQQLDEIRFDTQRLSHQLVSVNAPRHALGSHGFSVSFRGHGPQPTWLDGQLHDVEIVVPGDAVLPVDQIVLKVHDRDGKFWYGHGVVEDGRVVSWRKLSAA